MSYPARTPATPTLRLDTSGLRDNNPVSNPKTPHEPTSSIRTRARALSQAALPAALRPTSSPLVDKLPAAPSFASTSSALQGTDRAREERRKLLGHLLEQLRRRPRPPSVFDGPATRDPAAAKKRAGIAKGLAAVRRERSGASGPVDSDSDDEVDTAFSPDEALESMNRLRDVLTLSLSQQWHIFRFDTVGSRLSTSPFRRRRRSLDTGSRSPSPTPDDEQQAPELLSHCIAILHAVISEDCRFQVSSPRLLRPPNALQATSLDVALLLVHTHRDSPAIVSRIGFAVLPAFSTFRPEMHSRLLAFFEEGVLRGMLKQARQLHGLDESANILTEDFSGISMKGVGEAFVSIQVEAAQDDDAAGDGNAWHRWLLAFPDSTQQILSSNAPGQSLPLYHLASLVPPLLAAIAAGLDLESARVETLHRFYRLFSMIADLKPDAYLDLLQVIAYDTPKARRVALSLLSSHWPRAIGHPVVSKPLRMPGYLDTLPGRDRSGVSAHSPSSHPYAHQFVAWRFLPSSKPVLFEGQSIRDCRSCLKPIVGFGLFCPFCSCSVHFDCYDYPDGNILTQFALQSDPDTQKLAVHRFCHALPQSRSSTAVEQIPSGHRFRAVNLFNLALCFLCRQPLWGCSAQGLKCDLCDHFAHAHCLSSSPVSRCQSTPLDSSHMTIPWRDLQASFREHYSDFFLSGQDIRRRSYEEVSVCFDTLWMQSQILDNGIALSAIVVVGNKVPQFGTDDRHAGDFELWALLNDYENALLSGDLLVSPVLEDFLQETGQSPTQHSILYDWSTLVFLTSSVKTDHENLKLPVSDSSNFLGTQPMAADSADSASHPYELLSLAHLRDALGIGFQLRSDTAARLVLKHIHQNGLFDRVDMRPVLFEDESKPDNALCHFPLPLGLDISVDVETLVAAVEVCLADVDLAANEAGFLLLVRRFWPNEMATGYALRRLTKALLSWILSEDDCLAVILRDYIAQRRDLPGVRMASDPHPWPSSNSRAVNAAASNNGGDYVAHRRTLLKQYAAAWMLALHDQDMAFYAQTLYHLVAEIEEDSDAVENISFETPSESKLEARAVSLADRTLRSIVRLHQNAVIFTAFDDLFLRWLESTPSIGQSRKPTIALQRLLNREGGINQRSSSMNLLNATAVDSAGVLNMDPWNIVLRTASSSEEGLRKGLRWLSLFARSGVDIPVAMFQRFAALTGRFKLTLCDTVVLLEAAFSSTWLKSLGRQDLIATIGSLHLRLSGEVLSNISKHSSTSETARFVRLSLTCCLLLAGCDRLLLSSMKLATDEEVRDLPSRRSVNTRASMVSDPVNITTAFIDALGSYAQANDENISIMIAKFIHLFLTECSLLETYEVDNFILRNAAVLCASAWSFYELQNQELSAVRPSVLLRCLVVDAHPFEVILSGPLSAGAPWQTRHAAPLRRLDRLFRIVLDITNPAFNVEERQWRSSVSRVFIHYFTAMWQDPQEENRVAVDSWSRTLLPAHLDAISDCWNETLAKAPIADRIKLVSFLIQLQPHFVAWKVVSWPVIVEALLEEDYIQQNGENEDGPASAHLSMYGLSSRDSIAAPVAVDSDVVALHVSLVLLSLKMIAGGVPIDLFSLLKIKKHLVQIAGFSDVSTIPSATGQMFYIAFAKLKHTPDHAWPCVDELLPVLDAPHSFTFPASAMTGAFVTDDAQSTLLVGSSFVDVVLALVNDASDLFSAPYQSTKSLLECLLVVVYKHDLDSTPLRHLQGGLRRAVRRVLSVTMAPVPYDLRQLALSIAQAYIKKFPSAVGGFVIEALETAADLLISLSYNTEDVLAAQASVFVELCMSTFAENGILYAICKRRKASDMWPVLRFVADSKARTSGSQALRESLFRDLASRTADVDLDSFKTVMGNMADFIEKVFSQGHSLSLLQHVNMCLTNLVRRTAEWPVENFDPSAMLLIAAHIIRGNKSQSRDLLLYLDTTLRALLLRFQVPRQNMTRTLEIIGEVFRRPKKQGAATSGITLNPVSTTFCEILSEGFRGKARILPVTLTAMIETLISTGIIGSLDIDEELRNCTLQLADDGLFYLQNRGSQDGNADKDCDTSLAVAKLVHYGAEQNPEVLHRAFKAPRQTVSLRTWNILVLAALSHRSIKPGIVLMTHFSTCVAIYRDTLVAPPASGLASAAASYNHCYAAIKLWLLLDRKLSSSAEIASQSPTIRQNSVAYMVWNELWPPFLDVISQQVLDSQRVQNTPLAIATSSAVADLFLFLREFRSVVALETALQIAILNRLRVSGRPDNKLARALREIHEPAPNLSWTTLVGQVTNDVIAAEKLEMLDPGKPGPVYMRRESRAINA
ncbi:hypothetical protein FA95DRAFT_1480391 [Auriscalpium vulgare]|uniref:Uncharacterized protein n=1 Tax=Auriscalpium vulgare TaxID=40419 RepID=A0ACB8SDT6_9AGAM|nr:hypothetical protein FA95DRAFT_1480391 [Auriscalpium vulgare]